MPLPAPARADQPAPVRPASHVRPLGSRASYTLERGTALSPTLRALVGQLERSNVIVYVAEDPPRAGRSDAAIQFMGATAVLRFLRVTINIELGLRQRIALLGHELQHALEVAANPEIGDRASFLRYYERFGSRLLDPNTLDSQAAVEAGEQISLELMGAAPLGRRE